MASMKAFAELVSESMGLDGEITENVLALASRRLAWVESANQMTLDFVVIGDIMFRCERCKHLAPIKDHNTVDATSWCFACFYNEAATCQECGAHTDRLHATMVDHNGYCAACIDEHFSSCDDCDSVHRIDDMSSYGNGMLCEDCLKNYFTCEHCEDLCSNDDLTDVDGESWCDRCVNRDATRCHDCDCYTRDENAIGTNNGSLCMSCYEASYFTCEACDEVLHNDDYGEDGRCQSCSEDDGSEDDAASGILEYSADVCRILKASVPRGKIWFGIELEAQATYGNISSVAYDCRCSLGENYAITKSDSSTGNHGFEIVTIPKPIDHHTRIWTKFLANPPRGLRSWDTRGKCGMHVHVSRKPLSQLAIGKILVFVNAPANKRFIVALAGRECDYATLAPKKLTDVNKYYGRGAINLGNYDTIEFRIFRGTLKKSAFLKNLEFVGACVRFCRLTGINQLDVASFLAWFKDVRKDYPNLDAWLVQRSHISSRSKPNKKGGV